MSIMHDQRSGHAYGHQHVDVASVPMTTEVGIIGGGFGGIAAAVNLQKAGVDDFVVIESSDGPGGTWRDNTYPGAACDVPSILYSYSFHRKPEWSRVYATQPEILRYLEDTVDAFGLRHKLMLSTRIEEARWDEETGTWLLWTTGGSALRFRAVISSVGLLNVPKIPEVPGLDSFKGEQMHTSRWRHDVNIDGKAVAVVGTGSSSAQVVPGVIDRVGKLNLYQRQPAWIIGKDDRPYTHAELARHRIPFVLVLKRLSLFWGKVATRVSRDPQSARNKALQADALAYLERAVPDPELRRQFTPDYPYGCKRIVRDSHFFEAMGTPNAEVVPHAVVKLTEHGIISDDGRERPADVIVWATGFQATRYLSSLRVVGRRGAVLADAWQEVGGPEAFFGSVVSGFPNFFILYGPNTSARTSTVWFLENQARYAAKCIATLRQPGKSVLDISPVAQYLYSKWAQSVLSNSIFSSGCNNYFRAASGKNVTQFPSGAPVFWLGLRLFRPGFPLLFQRSEPLSERSRAWNIGVSDAVREER